MEQEKGRTNFIVITGAESTGKTQLAIDLAKHFNCRWIPELSREYIEKLDRPYTINDVELIARKQIEQFNSIPALANNLVIFDTGLIITKVWFDVVYRTCPGWLIDAINKLPKVLYLLCDIDLPWLPDKVRENGGEMRVKLNNIYKAELDNFGIAYKIVTGNGIQRLNCALDHINEFQKI